MIFGHVESIVASLGFIALIATGSCIWRGALLQTTLNRRFVAALLLFGCGLFVNRMMGLLLDIPMRFVLISDIMVCALMFAQVGGAIDKRFLWLSLLGLVSMFVAIFLPPGTEVDVQGFALLAGTLIVGLVWKEPIVERTR